MAPKIVILNDIEAIAREAARRVRRSAAAAIQARGRWRIALAGGSTPRALYRALGQTSGPAETPQAPADAIDWSRSDLFFGDERAVPPDHHDSNYGMVRETLLSKIAIPPDNVHRMRGEASDLDAAAREYQAELELERERGDGHGGSGGAFDPALDLALLGMGPDGHTASLFPGTTALDERQRLCVAVQVPKLSTTRLTLTYPVFERAREVIFLIVGYDKAQVLRQVIEDPARPSELPSQLIVRRAGPVTIFCDREAATELPTQTPVR
jgi:6-phosphogluconolactonase